METIKIFFRRAVSPRQLMRLAWGLLFFLLIELFRIYIVTPSGVYEEDMNSWYIHRLAYVSLILPFITLFEGKVRQIINFAVVILTPALCFFVCEYYLHNPAPIYAGGLILNGVIFYLLAFLLISLMGRTDFSMIFLILFSSGYGLINFFVDMYRGSSILPWDLASIGIASRIAVGYNYPIYPRAGVALVVTLLLIYVNLVCREKIHRPLYIRALVSAGSATGLTVLCLLLNSSVAGTLGITLNYFDSTAMYRANGSVVSFLTNLHFIFPDVPENYSKDLVQQLTEQYNKQGYDTATDTPENVIVIMNESLSDLSAVSNFETNVPFMPFLNSLYASGLASNLHVSVRGGNTCNTEFEFLTGLSMAFLPAGSIVYQQYIHQAIPTLVSEYSSLGYSTAALHPADPKNWRRDTVYDYMGFENTYFYDWFQGAETYRNFISDKGMYSKILHHLDSSDDPLFMFAITMQNHGGYYDNKDLPLDVHVKGLEDNISVSTYLSLMQESDRALQYLLEELSTSDERTLVVMFGDHQPSDEVVDPIIDIYGSVVSPDSAQYNQNFYVTPYLIWANYETDIPELQDISINYLPSLIKQVCHLPLTRAQLFLQELKAKYPIVTAQGFIDTSGQYLPTDTYASEPMLSQYACLQYNYLFDERLDDFWR